VSLSYDDPFVQESLCKASILDMAGHLHDMEPVSLNGGALWSASCQFHDERTPSLRFWHNGAEEPDSFYCFGCTKGGNIIAYVMYTRGCSPEDAFKYVCEFFEYEHPEISSKSILRKRITSLVKNKSKTEAKTSDVIFDASITIRDIVREIKTRFGEGSDQYTEIVTWADGQIKTMNIVFDTSQPYQMASNLFTQCRGAWFRKRNSVIGR